MSILNAHTQRDATEYHAFYPALIRLQKVAPHPLGRWVLWGNLILLFFLICWALIGRIDIVAVADGKLVPESYLKIVQPSEPGIIKEILVHEGETVSAGQVLMRMDAMISDADLSATTTAYERKRLQLERIDAEITNNPFQPDFQVSPALIKEIELQYQANQDALTATLEEEHSRLNKAKQEMATANQQLKSIESILPYYHEQEKAYEILVKKGFVGELLEAEKRRELIEKEQEMATQIHVIASAQASIEQSHKKIKQIKADYARQLYLERNEVQIEIDKLTKEIEKQRHKRSLLELKAPSDGVIKDLATHTSGTVVQPGTVLASLVPHKENMKVEVWVSNEDVGFVHPGQPVKLKFSAYSFQKYGMGRGVVEHVSADAQSTEEARDQGVSGQQALRYKALVKLVGNALEMDGVSYPLSVGMQTTAEIVLGDRTVAEYLLSPVQRAWHEAGRER
ncbi:HlyD family type I secretion periplasmic adaptor subunit [Aeromonas veronii]|uniref:HlyD family type I secretion periplasmic adaptor subunit n=1 Tax=Aeromonas veronii TaxID=654 RepID=UPI003D212C42